MKYLLDTNVLSELVQRRPDSRVVRRFHEAAGEVATSATVWHELCFGLERLPNSRRRQQLDEFLQSVVLSTIAILPYDQVAAGWHAAERARLQGLGRSPSFGDGQVASVAAIHGLVLVTRNTSDFEGFRGVRVENWH